MTNENYLTKLQICHIIVTKTSLLICFGVLDRREKCIKSLTYQLAQEKGKDDGEVILTFFDELAWLLLEIIAFMKG